MRPLANRRSEGIDDGQRFDLLAVLEVFAAASMSFSPALRVMFLMAYPPSQRTRPTSVHEYRVRTLGIRQRDGTLVASRTSDSEDSATPEDYIRNARVRDGTMTPV